MMATVLEKPENRFPKITEEGLDDLRKRIGVKIENTIEPWNYEATRDAIRHYAHGIGDDNPLWNDPSYAEKTTYGTLVALPSFLFTTSRIISAGYNIAGPEVEAALLSHPDIKECAVIGAPDATRGLVVKAFVVSSRAPSDAFVTELQNFTRERLAQHEFPRLVAFVDELPKTPAGKVHRKILRDREAAAALALTN